MIELKQREIDTSGAGRNRQALLSALFLAVIAVFGLAIVATGAVGAADTTTDSTNTAVEDGETMIFWDEEPPEAAEAGETITVSVEGQIADEGTVTLEESGLLGETLAEENASEDWSGTEFEIELGSDIDAEAGDELELEATIEDDGFLGDSDSTTAETISVADVEIAFESEPPATAAPGEEVDVILSGVAVEDSEICLEETGLLFSYDDCVDADEGSFEESFTVDVAEDLDADPGEEIELQGTLSSGFLGESAETDVHEIAVEDIPTEIDWDVTPPEEVDENDSFEVSLSGETPEEGEVCLEEDGLFSYDDCEEVDAGEFDVSFSVDAAEDIGLEPGDEAELQGTLDTGLFDGAETGTEAVSVSDTPMEIEWDMSPPEEVGVEDSFEVAFDGSTPEEAELCLEETGLFGYDDCTDVDGEFEESFTVDVDEDLGADSGEEIELQGAVDSGLLGEDDETTTELVEVETIPMEVEWDVTPPEEIDEDDSFEVSLSGETPEEGEVCLEEDGLFSYDDCEEVDAGEFDISFTVDAAEDLGADRGDEIELQGAVDSGLLGDEDETTLETVAVEDVPMNIEWDETPPEEVGADGSFEVVFEGSAAEDAEVCVTEEGLFGYDDCADVDEGEFEQSFEIDIEEDLGAEPGEEAQLRGTVDSGLLGEDDETATQTVAVEDIPMDIEWDVNPPEEVGADESFEVAFEGSTPEEAELCLEETGLFSYDDCEDVEQGEFEESFTLDVVEDLDAEPGEEIELQGVVDSGLLGEDAETETRIVEVEDIPMEADWDVTPPEEVGADDSFEVAFEGSTPEEAEVCVEEDGLLSYDECEDVEQGEFSTSFTVDVEDDLGLDVGEEAELQGTVGSGLLGEDAETDTQIVEVEDIDEEIDWAVSPPESVDENESFEVAFEGSTPEEGEVCVEEDGLLFSYDECEDVEQGNFSTSFTVDSTEDLGLESGDEADLQGTLSTGLIGTDAETSSQSVEVDEFPEEIEWTVTPPEEVGPDATFEVGFAGSTPEDAEVCVSEEGLLSYDECEDVDEGEFDISFDIHVEDDLGLEPGEKAELRGELDSGLFGGVETSTEAVAVEDIPLEVEWTEEPPEEIGHDATFEVGVEGSTPEAGDVCLEETGLLGYDDCANVTVGDFDETFTVDASEDLGLEPGDEAQVQGTVSTGLIGTDAETTTNVVSVADIPEEIEWTEQPPETVDENESFEVGLAGSTPTDGEICLEESGLFSYDDCEDVETGDFDVSFTVDATEDLGLEAGDETDLQGALSTGLIGTDAETSTETVSIDPATHIEFDRAPPEDVEPGSTITAEVSGQVESDGEVCLEEDGLFSYDDCVEVSGEFNEQFTVDTEDDLELETGDRASLTAEVSEDGLFGDSDETSTEDVTAVFEDDAFLAIDAVGTNQPVEGDNLEVAAVIENVGDLADTQSLDIEVESVGSASSDVSVDPRDLTSETFVFPTTDGDAGTYTVTASTEDDEYETTITIAEEGSASEAAGSGTAPDELEA